MRFAESVELTEYPTTDENRKKHGFYGYPTSGRFWVVCILKTTGKRFVMAITHNEMRYVKSLIRKRNRDIDDHFRGLPSVVRELPGEVT